MISTARAHQKIESFRMRLAEPDDVQAIKAFYLDNMREKSPDAQAAFPIPSLLEISQAVADRNFLIVENPTKRAIVAASGLFRLLDHNDGRFAEMSGMYVAAEAGGLGPHSLQDLMVAVRIARFFCELRAEDGQQCAVSFVKDDNHKSWEALERSGMERALIYPTWLQGEFVSWFGWNSEDDWRTYRVGLDALINAAHLILHLEKAELMLRLSRVNRDDGHREIIKMTFDRNLWRGVLVDAKDILIGHSAIEPPDIPEQLSFGTRRRR